MNRNAERGIRNPGKSIPRSACRIPNAKGFTLLEVLLAIAILSMILTVIYMTFSSAGRSVEEAEAIRDRTDLARTLMVRLCDDFANAYFDAAMPETIFEGRQSSPDQNQTRLDSVSLTTLTNWRKPNSSEMDLWEVGYRFEEKPEGNGYEMIRREKRGFGSDNIPGEGGTDLEITDRVRELRLRYYDGASMTWRDDWNARSMGKMPIAVEVLLVLDDGSVYLTQVDVRGR
jgi:general secretion pathway protein J